jgi:hypothetical protein
MLRDMIVDADTVVDLLVKAYREELEDNGDLVADELVKGWPNEVKKATYDDGSDTIMFSVNKELYDLLPDAIKNNAVRI